MMSAGWGWAVAGEGFVEGFEVGHFGYVEPAPVGEAAGAALASGLVGEQAGLAVLHPVVVRFDDSRLALIDEGDLVASVDSVTECGVDWWKRVAYY